MTKYFSIVYVVLLILMILPEPLAAQAHAVYVTTTNTVEIVTGNIFDKYAGEIESQHQGVAPLRCKKNQQIPVIPQQKNSRKITRGETTGTFHSCSSELFDNTYLCRLYPSHNFW